MATLELWVEEGAAQHQKGAAGVGGVGGDWVVSSGLHLRVLGSGPALGSLLGMETT